MEHSAAKPQPHSESLSIRSGRRGAEGKVGKGEIARLESLLEMLEVA
jgi:hypothetical protein